MKTEKLKLTETEHEGLKVGIRKDGKKYSVRNDRLRYFFPDEWNLFYNSLNPKKQMIYDLLIQTGARIHEALGIKKKHIEFERNIKTITLYNTKTKAKKGETIGKRRTIPISDEFARRLKKYTKDMKEDELIFKQTSTAIFVMFKNKLIKTKINRPYDFSLHNIRKTHGMWIKSFGAGIETICDRLGHNYETYLKHYSSPAIFDSKDNREMVKILGNIPGVM